MHSSDEINAIVAKTHTVLPDEFKGDAFENVDLSKLIELTNERMRSAPQYVLFPSHLELGTIQKCIIFTGAYSFSPSTDGVPNSYILFPAVSQGMYYDTKILYDGCAFIIMLPFKSFIDMFYRDASIKLDLLLLQQSASTSVAPVFEMEFKKITERKYELVYLAKVLYDGTQDTIHGPKQIFTKEKLLFKLKGKTRRRRT